MSNPPIRIGIHETNSSSSHLFGLGVRGRLASTIPLSEDDKICLELDSWIEAGDKFNSPEDKLTYLLCFAHTIFSDPDQEYEDSDEEEQNQTEEFLEVLKIILGVVRDFTGAKEIELSGYYEYIDHQSRDMIKPESFKDPEFIKEFVFNPGTWVYPIWDSFDVYPGFFECQDFPILYTIRVTLPGISEEFVMEVRYCNSEDIKSRLDYFLEDYEYDPKEKKFYHRQLGFLYNSRPGCVTYSRGTMSFGDYEVVPEIILPND